MDDYKAAMKGRDELKVSVIRLLLAAIDKAGREKKDALLRAEVEKRVGHLTGEARAQAEFAAWTAVAEEAVAHDVELTEDEVTAVIGAEINRRRQSLEAFEKAKREDLAEKERAALAILQTYSPQMSEDEIRALAQQVIREVGALSPKEMGKVMATLMPKVKGKADGKMVSQIVKSLLEGTE